jgi:hypothetical protein
LLWSSSTVADSIDLSVVLRKGGSRRSVFARFYRPSGVCPATPQAMGPSGTVTSEGPCFIGPRGYRTSGRPRLPGYRGHGAVWRVGQHRPDSPCHLCCTTQCRRLAGPLQDRCSLPLAMGFTEMIETCEYAGISLRCHVEINSRQTLGLHRRPENEHQPRRGILGCAGRDCQRTE